MENGWSNTIGMVRRLRSFRGGMAGTFPMGVMVTMGLAGEFRLYREAR